MNHLKHIVILGILAALPVSALLANDQTAATRRPPMGSLARQRLLKMRLSAIMPTPLSTALNHNRHEWESLTPDEREQYRSNFFAFLHKTPDQQTKLLSHYEKLFKMSAGRRDAYRRRAKWLKVVVASFTSAQRKSLQAMSPADRARKLLARKAKLLRQGKLTPTPQPSGK